ncbi:hypothetical protein Tco_1082776 [Tanacetum coccineum]|uniref:Reverse transcriptase domain-containing protein n=1 Tax=Tanacetum coccineum TaxID=301880 RepID=A0ABQ5I1C7_9ASTR
MGDPRTSLTNVKTPSPSPAFIKEIIDVLRTMIKEHDQQAKMKATPRKLAYADSNKEAPARSLARGFYDRFSLESSGTSDTHRQTHSASKSQRTPSKNKEPTHLRRSRRLEDRSITKEKARRERSKSRRKSLDTKRQAQTPNMRKNEGLEAFMDRFKSESSHIKGVPPVLRISAFMHGHGHPELAKKLNDKIPKMVDKMFKRVRAFIRGEVVTVLVEMVRPSQGDKGYVRPAWTVGLEKARNRGSPREAQRNMGVYAPYPLKDTFTPLTKTPKEILAMESVSFPEPPPLIGTLKKQNLNNFKTTTGTGVTTPTTAIRHVPLSGGRGRASIDNGISLQMFPTTSEGIQPNKNDKEKIGFHTKEGVYYFTHMPKELKNSTATLQTMMEKVLADQRGRNMEIYLEELVIKSKSELDLVQDVEETLRKLKRVKIKIDPVTSLFGVKEGRFLGHMVTKEGVRADPEKYPIRKVRVRFEATEGSDWTNEAEEALQRIKRKLNKLQTLVVLKEVKKFFGQGEQVHETLDENERGTLNLNKELQAKSTPTPRVWRLYLGKETIEEGSGVGIILVSPEERMHSYASRLKFNTSDHAIDYEALLAGLAISVSKGMKDLHVFMDSPSPILQNSLIKKYLWVSKQDHRWKRQAATRREKQGGWNSQLTKAKPTTMGNV